MSGPSSIGMPNFVASTTRVAPALAHLADVRLAQSLRVDVRGVEQRDPRIDHGTALLEVAAPAEVVRPEPDDRDLRPLQFQVDACRIA